MEHSFLLLARIEHWHRPKVPRKTRETGVVRLRRILSVLGGIVSGQVQIPMQIRIHYVQRHNYKYKQIYGYTIHIPSRNKYMCTRIHTYYIHNLKYKYIGKYKYNRDTSNLKRLMHPWKCKCVVVDVDLMHVPCFSVTGNELKHSLVAQRCKQPSKVR